MALTDMVHDIMIYGKSLSDVTLSALNSPLTSATSPLSGFRLIKLLYSRCHALKIQYAAINISFNGLIDR